MFAKNEISKVRFGDELWFLSVDLSLEIELIGQQKETKVHLQNEIWKFHLYLGLLPCLLSCSCTPKFLRILRVTSQLLIVLADRKGTIGYWLHFCSFRIMAPLNSMRMGKCRGYLQATKRFGVISFISLTWSETIFVPPSLYGRFYLVFIPTRNDFWSILGCLSPPDVMSVEH